MQKATDGGTLVIGPARPGCAGDIVCEAERYLALVDVFRAEGCEPRWRSQAAALATARREQGQAMNDLSTTFVALVR